MSDDDPFLDVESAAPLFPRIPLDRNTNKALKALANNLFRVLQESLSATEERLAKLEAGRPAGGTAPDVAKRLEHLEARQIGAGKEIKALAEIAELTPKRLGELEGRIVQLERRAG